MNILINKHFQYGIASLKYSGLEFFNDLFNLLVSSKVENLFFTINKMSIVIDSKLNEWILDISEEIAEVSSVHIKYILTKYAEIEASEKVIEILLKDDSKVSDVLTYIKADMENHIKKNSSNLRMSHTQNPVYLEMISLIDYSLDHMSFTESTIKNEFSWTKFMWAFDLWLTEKRLGSKKYKEIVVNLDEGINKKTFEELSFEEVNENCDSKEYVSLRVVDMLVVLCGKMISKLTEAVKYDFSKPMEPKHLSKEWFVLSRGQFELIKKMEDFIFRGSGQYDYIVDTYFDDGVLFQTYINYIAHFNSYTSYQTIKSNRHSQYHLEWYGKMSQIKYAEGFENEIMARRLFGTYRNSINIEQIRPL